jgi:hypothetical protein
LRFVVNLAFLPVAAGVGFAFVPAQPLSCWPAVAPGTVRPAAAPVGASVGEAVTRFDADRAGTQTSASTLDSPAEAAAGGTAANAANVLVAAALAANRYERAPPGSVG